ncbi:hypothetical protein C8034_v006068 [Colletotrichum sidae]|uniref:Uncharacterized protein n=1 Tax=Colletotrichum sidae TaxID=1347389 RepID=A0A4R8TT62_9PEZI|nr:hypothetical protein C8034_v006068 [Colletotrichum sidae]
MALGQPLWRLPWSLVQPSPQNHPVTLSGALVQLRDAPVRPVGGGLCAPHGSTPKTGLDRRGRPELKDPQAVLACAPRSHPSHDGFKQHLQTAPSALVPSLAAAPATSDHGFIPSAPTAAGKREILTTQTTRHVSRTRRHTALALLLNLPTHSGMVSGNPPTTSRTPPPQSLLPAERVSGWGNLRQGPSGLRPHGDR